MLCLTLAACGENTATPAPTPAATTIAPTSGAGTTAPGTTGTGVALDLTYPKVVRKTQLTYDDVFPGLGNKDVSYFQAFITDDTADRVKQYYSDQFTKLSFSVVSGTGDRPAEVLGQRASTTLQAMVLSRTEQAAQQQNLQGDQILVVVLVRNTNSRNPLGPRPSTTP